MKKKLFILFLMLTIYNIVFDWIFNRLGEVTIAWESGVVGTIILCYFSLRKQND